MTTDKIRDRSMILMRTSLHDEGRKEAGKNASIRASRAASMDLSLVAANLAGVAAGLVTVVGHRTKSLYCMTHGCSPFKRARWDPELLPVPSSCNKL